jgi:hypothetical protein
MERATVKGQMVKYVPRETRERRRGVNGKGSVRQMKIRL